MKKSKYTSYNILILFKMESIQFFLNNTKYKEEVIDLDSTLKEIREELGFEKTISFLYQNKSVSVKRNQI